MNKCGGPDARAFIDIKEQTVGKDLELIEARAEITRLRREVVAYRAALARFVDDPEEIDRLVGR